MARLHRDTYPPIPGFFVQKPHVSYGCCNHADADVLALMHRMWHDQDDCESDMVVMERLRSPSPSPRAFSVLGT